jgi:signal transduction histidine kinase
MYSRIDVIARHVGNEIQVTVEDEGQGIRAELRTQVFEKFARAAEGQAGSGMGLAIAKSIIDAHDGRIWIDGRRTGRGSAITFALPVKVVHAETSSQYES